MHNHIFSRWSIPNFGKMDKKVSSKYNKGNNSVKNCGSITSNTHVANSSYIVQPSFIKNVGQANIPLSLGLHEKFFSDWRGW